MPLSMTSVSLRALLEGHGGFLPMVATSFLISLGVSPVPIPT